MPFSSTPKSIGSYQFESGSSADDYFYNITGQTAVFGGDGDDSFNIGSQYADRNGYISIPLLVGGRGNDYYRINDGDYALIADYGGGQSDTFRSEISLYDVVFAVVDRHHYVMYDYVYDTLLFFIDPFGNDDRNNRIETFRFWEGTFESSQLENLASESARNLGFTSWQDLDRSGVIDFSRAGMSPNRIDEYVNAAKYNSSRVAGNLDRALTRSTLKKESLYIRDFDGVMHGGAEASVSDDYMYQGRADVNDDGTYDWIYTNNDSGRWAIIEEASDGIPDWDDFGSGGGTRVVGLYDDPLVLSGEVEAGSPHDSQVRFQNDLYNDNLRLGSAADVDNDGFGEVFWKTTDGSAFLRSIHHLDGNVKYANYMNAGQMTDYLSQHGHMGDIGSSLGL
jgi:hypothetical protein